MPSLFAPSWPWSLAISSWTACSHDWYARLTTIWKPWVSFKSVLSSSASMVQLAEALEKPGKPTFFETPAWSLSMGCWSFVGVGMVGMEKRRAWVQGGLGTSTTPHARRFMGSRETSRGQQVTPLGPPASSSWTWPSGGGT